MRQRSFFFRLLAGNILLVAILIGMSFALSYWSLNREYIRQEEQRQMRTLLVLRDLFQQEWPMPRESLQARCLRLAQAYDIRLTVIARDGQVLADSDAEPLYMELHLTPDRPEILAALRGEIGQDNRLSTTINKPFRYLAAGLYPGGQDDVAAVVRIAGPVKPLAGGQLYVRQALFWSAVASVTVAGCLGILISWIWARPLQQITRTAGQLAAGNLGIRPAIRGSRELEQLNEALNEMRSSLSRQIEVIADQRENLQTVVANLGEGVLALNADGTIVLINPSAEELFDLVSADCVGQHLQSVVRVPAVLDLLTALEKDQSASTHIELMSDGKRRSLDVHAVRIFTGRPNSINILMVIRDITEATRMATVKAEFVANASHELRTPLATIRAAVDSLGQIDPTNEQAFHRIVDILDRHALRLENMTRDLLDLHLVEQAKSHLKLESIDLESLSSWVRNHHAGRAVEGQVNLRVKSMPSDGAFCSDRRLVQLILQNLVENAIKFTPPGGRVDCELEVAPDQVFLRVRDSGCGIPPEIQDRIFERFFQADPSRSGQQKKRGTGLGLAIVKYAAERLGATITVDSEVGAGTTMAIAHPILRDGDA